MSVTRRRGGIPDSKAALDPILKVVSVLFIREPLNKPIRDLSEAATGKHGFR